MQGFDSIPENIEWKDPIWSRSERLRGLWENEHVENALSLVGTCSNSRKYFVCGDDEGVIRLFSFPCREKSVSCELSPHVSILSNVFPMSSFQCRPMSFYVIHESLLFYF